VWFYVYILASRRNGTLYIGHTDDLIRRVTQHREHLIPSFTARYDVVGLVWWEPHGSRDEAFRRERAMKKWRRGWKLELIERFNPEWRDLYPDLFDNAEVVMQYDPTIPLRSDL
jgi:putative endonuclease